MYKYLFILLIFMPVVTNSFYLKAEDKALSKIKQEKRELATYLLKDAIKKEDLKKIKKYVELGADINVQDSSGYTALTLAVYKVDENLTKLLISRGANVNIVNNSGNTPAMNVADRCLAYEICDINAEENIKMIEILLDNGLDVNIKNNEGKKLIDIMDGFKMYDASGKVYKRIKQLTIKE